MVRNTFIDISNTECCICLCIRNIFFNNVCACKPLVCKVCIVKIDICPFCRFEFSNEIISKIRKNILCYRIHDLLYPFRSILVTKNQYDDFLYNRLNTCVFGLSNHWVISIEDSTTRRIFEEHNILVENNYG